MHNRSTSSRRLLLVLAALAAGCATMPGRDASPQPTAVAVSDAPAAVAAGRVDGGRLANQRRTLRGDIGSFAPRESATSVDAEALNLKQVFDQVGGDSALWYQHVQTLANPYFEGRSDGSPGMERARHYIEFYYDMYGLQPIFSSDNGELSHRQHFEFEDWQRVKVEVAHAALEIDGQSLEAGADFVAFGNSASGRVSGPLAFVGYGIDEGEEGYTSFDADTSLAGRVALLLRYEPLDDEGASRWGQRRFSAHAGLSTKMQAVAKRGAAAILMVNPPGAQQGAVGLEQQPTRYARGRLDIPVAQITPEIAERLLAASDPEGRDLMTWRRLADNGEVRCVNLRDAVSVSLDAEVNVTGGKVPAANLAAVLPGRGALADQWLVIGGHYDHNGYGWFGTRPEEGPLFPGADDNASGTAGVLVLARRFAEAYRGSEQPARSVLFITFDAEERGLYGSRHFCDNPPIDLSRVTAMLNMDMIGRLRSNELSVLGTATGYALEELLEPHFAKSGLALTTSPGSSGRSDDANFINKRVPAMHFFTGMHPEYTTPADHAFTVNPIGAERVIDLIEAIGIDLVSRPESVAFAEPGARGRGEDRGYGRVRLGIRPAMETQGETGIPIESVSEGTTADEAGVRAGDVLLWWDDIELENMQTLMERLQSQKPGDVVRLVVRRDGKEIELTATLKASQPAGE